MARFCIFAGYLPCYLCTYDCFLSTGFNGDCAVIFTDNVIEIDENNAATLSFFEVGNPDFVECRLDVADGNDFIPGQFVLCTLI